MHKNIKVHKSFVLLSFQYLPIQVVDEFTETSDFYKMVNKLFRKWPFTTKHVYIVRINGQEGPLFVDPEGIYIKSPFVVRPSVPSSVTFFLRGNNSALGGHRALPKVANERYCNIVFILCIFFAHMRSLQKGPTKFFFFKCLF